MAVRVVGDTPVRAGDIQLLGADDMQEKEVPVRQLHPVTAGVFGRHVQRKAVFKPLDPGGVWSSAVEGVRLLPANHRPQRLLC